MAMRWRLLPEFRRQFGVDKKGAAHQGRAFLLVFMDLGLTGTAGGVFAFGAVFFRFGRAGLTIPGSRGSIVAVGVPAAAF
jgi:hypothetical protein